MKRNVANLLIIFLALFIAVALLNFIQGLQALPTGSPAGRPAPLPGFPDFGASPLLLFWIMAMVGLGVFLVAFLYFRPKGRSIGLEELLPLILGGILLVSLLFLQDFQQRAEQLAAEEGGEDGGTGAEGDPPPEESQPFDFIREGLQSSPAMLFILISFIAFAAIYFLAVALQARRAQALGLSIRRKQALKQEMAEALEDRIYHLRLGEDMRAVVLGAYRDMVHLFASYGVPSQKHQTAREVEALAFEKLGLSGKASRALRRLFEEARYSFHVLTEDQRQTAIESLHQVKVELGA